MSKLALLVTLAGMVALVVAAPLSASEQDPTLEELEAEVMCPTCNAPLNRSHAPVADRMRTFIVNRIALGSTKSEIKGELVTEFGERVLTSPTRGGLNTLAWALPLIGLGGAVAGVYVVLRRWRRARAARSLVVERELDPEVEKRIDDALTRFDRT
ncbi:MAG: cytochrome c-type biogenesis protein CcmH [Gaiellales bacterium]